MGSRRALAFMTVAALAFAGCGGDDGGGGDSTETPSTETPSTDAPATDAPATDAPATDAPATDAPATNAPEGDADGVLNVPEEYPTIQAAVDASEPHDLVLIASGTYNEAVNVETNELTIRGVDRNTVILDGEFELDNGIRVLGANGVAIENMTAINYTFNGFFWTGVEGYRGSYLTAWRNGDYGIYAFDSVKGQLEYSYAAGSPDAGFYIGQCYPCDAVIDTVVSEHNGLGYSGTNSGGNLTIVRSTFNNNRAGVVPNSGSYELCYPERETTIVGNVVHSNNQQDTPAIDVAILAMGNGILSAGGVANVIERNLVYDHDKTGIGLVPFLEEDPSDTEPTEEDWAVPCDETKDDVPGGVTGAIIWNSKNNVVRDNVLEDNRAADIAVGVAEGDGSGLGNCFAGNTFTLSAPTDLEALAPCDGAGAGDWTANALNVVDWLVEAETRPPSVPFEEAELPERPTLDNMPDAATAPARPATDVPFAVDLDAIAVPVKPS